jgi:hypothetical protein
MDRAHREALEEAYIRYLVASARLPGANVSEDPEHQAAWLAVQELLERDPDEGWSIVRTLVERAPSDETLGMVAAGPLEDLLRQHGPVLIDRVEEESRKSDRLRLALSGVWGLRGSVFERWYGLMREYGFADGQRAALCGTLWRSGDAN